MGPNLSSPLTHFLSLAIQSSAIVAASFMTSALEQIVHTKALPSVEKTAQMKEDSEIIQTILNFIDEFLRSMNDLYRTDCEEKQSFLLEPTYLRRDVIEPAARMITNRSASFVIHVECPDDLVVATNCLRLKEVLLNLGHIGTKNSSAGFIGFRAEIVENLVEISVEDSGPGIPAERVPKLFSGFESNADVRDNRISVGLRLCKKLLLAMGGDLYHDSNAAATGFVIRLNTEPLPQLDLKQKITPEPHTALPDPVTLLRLPTPNDEVLHTSQTHFSTETNNTNTLTTAPTEADIVVKAKGDELPINLSVLFVDDDAILRTMFKRALKRVAPNWKVQEADCGESALEIIAAFGVDDAPDLIFVDQYMHGTATVSAMRSMGVKTCICGLSANDVECSFRGAGADFFITKPLPCALGPLREQLTRMVYMDRKSTVGGEGAEPST